MKSTQTSSAAQLRAQVLALLPDGASGIAVGLSGGTDSASLLAVLANGTRALPLRAVHIDHGLQAAAAQFRGACSELCARLDIPLVIHAVAVATDGVSIEAAARAARYAALSRDLRVSECLLTAHHLEDQAETLLLQLMRGAGLKGLAGMPTCRALGRGWHVRPLLGVARERLHRIGTELGVRGIDDPMNADLRFDRAYLRSQVMPALQARWPAVSSALARSATHLGAAQSLLDRMAAAQCQRVRDGAALSISGLRSLEPAERLNALRYWIGSSGAEPPSSARLSEALRQMLNAGRDQSPRVVWGELALRRYRDRLFLTAADLPTMPVMLPWRSDARAHLHLGPSLGDLQWRPRRGGLDPAQLAGVLEVRRRCGGETIKPLARGRSQTIQHLCQVYGVLPWMRNALPLLFADDRLIAVGDLWLDARFCVAPDAFGVEVIWQDAPAVTG